MKLAALLQEMPMYTPVEYERQWHQTFPIDHQTFTNNFIVLKVESVGEYQITYAVKKNLGLAVAGIAPPSDQKTSFIGLVKLNSYSLHDIFPNSLQVDLVKAYNDPRAKGLAYKLYRALIDNGYTIFSDKHQYIGGKKLWDRLIQDQSSDFNVYVYDDKAKQFVKDNSGDPIKFDGKNIPDVWTPTTNSLLLVATKHS